MDTKLLKTPEDFEAWKASLSANEDVRYDKPESYPCIVAWSVWWGINYEFIYPSDFAIFDRDSALAGTFKLLMAEACLHGMPLDIDEDNGTWVFRLGPKQDSENENDNEEDIERHRLQVWIEAAVYEALEAEAAQSLEPVSVLVRRILREHTENYRHNRPGQ